MTENKSATRYRPQPTIYDKPKPARIILAKALNITVDEAKLALIALVEGGYGIAPRNPTNGMLAGYIEATIPPKHHEAVITAIGKARVRWQAMLQHGTEMAMSLKYTDVGSSLTRASTEQSHDR